LEKILEGGLIMLVRVCDICGSRKNVSQRSYKIGDYIDPVEGRRTEIRTVDLCKDCEFEVLRKFVDSLANKNSAEFLRINATIVEIIDRMIKERRKDEKD